MTREDIEKVFNQIFNTNGRTTIGVNTETINHKDDTLVIDGTFYIRKVPKLYKLNTIAGVCVIDGYVVEVGVTRSNYPDGPDDADFVSIGEPVRSLNEAVVITITVYAKMRAECEFEKISITEALANNEF